MQASQGLHLLLQTVANLCFTDVIVEQSGITHARLGLAAQMPA